MPRDNRLYMTFPIDFWRHPKVARLSDAAFRAFVESNGHSRILESDGRLEAEDAEFMWKKDVLDELVRSHPTRPLMVMDGADYVLRDYAEHQFTRADREKLTEQRSRAGKISANKRSTRVEQALDTSKQTATEIGIGKEITTSKEVVRPRKRGTRVPADFVITDDMRAWAKTETPLVDLDAKLGEWIDYWTGAPNGIKVDWLSTWRNGMRKQQEFAERDLPRGPKKIAPQDEWKYR